MRLFMLNLNKVPDDSDSVYMSSSTVVNSSLWHARLGHVHYKRMLEMSKDDLIPAIDENLKKCTTCMLTKITRQPFKSITRKSVILELIHSDLCDFHATPSLGNKKYVITFIDDASRFCYVYLLHAKDEALDKFRIYKTEVELQQNDLVKTLRTDRGGEYYDPVFFQSVGIIHETTAPYTPQQNGVAERKNRALKEMVNSMLSYSGLSEGFWGEAMLTACYLLNRVPNKRNKTTPYELWYKKRPNLSYLRVWGCRAVVRLTDPKRKTLGEKGIDCIFVGYAEHSKAYRFYVIEPNDSVSINSIIESRDAIFDENRFSSIPRPKDIIPNLEESQRDDHSDDVPSETPEPRRGKRAKKAKSYGSDFQLYLVEGSRDQVGSQYSYCYSIEEDPRTYNEAVQSRDAAFWKEAIDDEIGSIMENNTWVLSDLPPGCKPLGCKWIFKRKMKVDGTIDKFKARLVIQGFRQKEGIDYFDTYAPVARITTIRLLLALAAIHNLVIHQMDVKTAFLNGDLDEEVYMKQPEGFVMPGNEHKVCKLVKSLYGLKQAPKQWHQKFDEVVLSSGFHLNQSDKCVYSKFDNSGKGVIICLYVDDMLIFGTDQNQVDKTKKFLSSRFSMKDMGEADIILGIKIKRENKGIVITQSHYIEKILKKFNREDCSPVSTPMDPVEKLKPNTGKPVDQLEYSRAIGCLMYAMTSTRPDIAYAVGRLSRFTSNPSRQHWKAITRVFKYLRGTKDYGLSYVGYPSVLEGYSDASWINHVEDSSSTSGWVFLLGGGAISWASKKQTCITSSTMESEFVALAAAGKEAEWLRNLIHEIPIWPKPIAPISIRCDSAPTMARAYSQIYNGKSRHLGVRHSMVRELIRNGVISIEFVRTQHNLADHLTKGLARDLVNKSVKGMGLKSK
ncbi:zinc finger, CCHC-type containing protein [Tanacetum coccineum]